MSERAYDPFTKTVRIKALDVHQGDDGEWLIELPAKSVSQEQSKVLNELFPNTLIHVEGLLDKEALLAASTLPTFR